MSISNQLKNARLRAGFTQKYVYENLGVPQSTFSSWEIGKSEPDAATLLKLCDIYGLKSLQELRGDAREVPAEEFFGYIMEQHAGMKSVDLFPYEQGHIKKYRALDHHGKTMVDTVTDIEHKRVDALKRDSDKKAKPASAIQTSQPINDFQGNEMKFVEMKVFDEPAAAGFGNYLSGYEYSYEIKSFKASEIPKSSDYGIRISGDSMEPEIANGSIVWVREQVAIDDGQVGVFVLDGEAYCKKLFINHKMKRVELVSLNPAYKNIIVSGDDNFKTVGLVLSH